MRPKPPEGFLFAFDILVMSISCGLVFWATNDWRLFLAATLVLTEIFQYLRRIYHD